MTPELSIRIRSAAPAAMITVSLRPAVPATDPMIVLLLPVVREKPAAWPIPILVEPVLFLRLACPTEVLFNPVAAVERALYPIAVLLPPEVLAASAFCPTPTLLVPLKLPLANAPTPTAVLEATALAPSPTVRPWITAPPVSVETPVTPRVVLAVIAAAARVPVKVGDAENTRLVLVVPVAPLAV